jgi:single-stranded-DNA-specific exonuclease
VGEAKFQIVEAGKEKDYCLFAFDASWPLGLLGLAAGKISDTFNRPAVLMTEIGGEIKGSARSVEGFSIISALQKLEDIFSHYGGHPMAAGLTLKKRDNLKIFQEKMIALAKTDLQDKELEQMIKIDMELSIDKINLPLAEEIGKLAPFGEANPEPLFLSQNLVVRGTQIVGNGTKHLRLMVSGENGIQYKMMGFYLAHWCEVLKFGDKINAVYELGVNEWNGRREPQLKIMDLEKICPV